jgi:hypothetical protein
MKPWLPLLQTLIWPIFIAALVAVYRRQLSSLLNILVTRLERGDSLKLPGGVELGGARPLENDKTYISLIQAVLRALRDDVSPDKLEQVERKVTESIRESGFLTIDSRPFDARNGKESTVPYYQYRTVSALLDDIRVSIGAPNLSFGTRWIIKIKGGKRFTEKDIGRQWAASTQQKSIDYRTLDQIGIEPGMTLEVIKPDLKP